MIRFNKLKIFISATEAKPGGNIGAMLSPYLFSTNMSDFCKRFNEQSKDYNNGVWLPVIINCDTLEKYYTFFIKNISMTMFLINIFLVSIKINIIILYDMVLLYNKLYHISLYNSALIIFSTLKSFKKKNTIIQMKTEFLVKIKKLLNKNV